ncbi:unnamed protein product [Ilex paraguariensis]|uniref:Uncharacterized protein n=1 Tax=Ilex paraguariensis TaxID=185542 RepID=A0ABC8RKR9_9AQUA
MAKSSDFLVIFALFIGVTNMLLSFSAVEASTSSGDHYKLGWIPAMSSATCRGTIAECLGAGDETELGFEFEMDSEINRRMLAARRYISYGALKRNTVPCSRRGASYYNCRPGAPANPYTRGCSAITRCRRNG